MAIPRFFVIPTVVLAATAAYIVVNPGGGAVQSSPPGAQIATVSEPVARPGTTATVTPEPLPAGLSGNFRYRTASGNVPEEVEVSLPSGRELDRHAEDTASSDEYSADGEWRTHICANSTPGCAEEFVAEDGRTQPLAGEIAWSPAGHRYAMRIYGENGAADQLLIGDPGTAKREPLVTAGAHVYGFGWDASGSSVIAATAGDNGWQLSRFRPGLPAEPLATMPALPQYVYRSPDGTKFGFTSSGDTGWHMQLFDAASGLLRDLGPMGSDGPDGKPVTVGPDQKGPMYVAWSPDAETIAFGGGFDAPYVMKIVDLRSGMIVTSQFPDGYPGEIKWNASGTQLAVSTYNVERTHHEVYLVDPGTGAQRHLISGCIIVWSPDGKFIADHGERAPGINIVDVQTGAWGRLTTNGGDMPISWGAMSAAPASTW